MELYDLPADYFDRYRENIEAVSVEDVARVARKYIDPDRAIIVIVGNAKQVREPLGTLGYPIHDIDIDGNALPLA
jgi:zinc protease